jgi:hypothetical protein
MTAYGRIPAGSAKYDERQFIAQLASVGGSEEGPQVAVRFTLFGVAAQKLLL